MVSGSISQVFQFKDLKTVNLLIPKYFMESYSIRILDSGLG